MKSMCQDSRRNSPSVIDWRPTASWRRMTSRIAASSISFSAASSMVPAARSSRASRTSGGRSRLPTWSARKGGLVRADMWRLSRGSGMVAARSYIVDNLVDSLDDDA